MHPTVVINVVGLTPALLGDNTPNLCALARDGIAVPLTTITPAVTCSVQSTFLTGLVPSQHGIVANGWYFRDQAEVRFWRQSNRLVRGEKVWESARRRDPAFTCAKLFWWYNMYSSADISITPRPIYPADGRKIPEIYTQPASLGERVQSTIGDFPFFNFWGPQADIRSSEWIAEAALNVDAAMHPTLMLIYLPHLDYNLQRLGPGDPKIGQDLRAIDRVCGRLIEQSRGAGKHLIVLSEYGVTQVQAPIHINRILREAGYLRVRAELSWEALDPGASEAFAVADHQVAHIYVNDPRQIPAVRALLEAVNGIERVLDSSQQAEIGLAHHRSGELVAIAAADRWFSYYYWLDDACAPDFARTVDIHRKPGYDPVELFVDPKICFPKMKVAKILLKKQLGFRYLMDVIPLDASLVKGSHGRVTDNRDAGPLFLTSAKDLVLTEQVNAVEVKDLILRHIFGATFEAGR
jgi:predicted AlkP superfamily pyrophosphatase or phosphodiesterase